MFKNHNLKALKYSLYHFWSKKHTPNKNIFGLYEYYLDKNFSSSRENLYSQRKTSTIKSKICLPFPKMETFSLTRLNDVSIFESPQEDVLSREIKSTGHKVSKITKNVYLKLHNRIDHRRYVGIINSHC